jgi:hypothetical protein
MTIDKEQENLQFKNRNIIRISEDELDKPIYRVFSKHWLIDALTKKKNALVKPRLWDDPFENFIFNSTAETDTGLQVGFDTIRENFYGQCWTFSTEESDALWRIYSPKKDGFRVKTTIRKMFDTFYDAKHQWAMIAFYIGRIQYETESEIRDYFENPDNLKYFIFDSSGNGQIETLLVKRMEFKHENELRLIFAGHSDWYDTTLNSYEFPIDINFHFDEILADPRMDDDNPTTFSDSVKEIRALGYNNPIEKSKLYQIPNLKLKLNVS